MVWLPPWKIHPAVWPVLLQAAWVLLASGTSPPVQQSLVGGCPAGRGLAGPGTVRGGAGSVAPSCSPGLPRSGGQAQLRPMGRRSGDFSNPQGRMSSLPLPVGGEQRGSVSPYMEPRAWCWGPRPWNTCLSHTPPFPSPLSSSEGGSALPALALGWASSSVCGSLLLP